MRLGDTTVADATFSPDGRMIATASPYGHIVLWDAKSGREILQMAEMAALCPDPVQPCAATFWHPRRQMAKWSYGMSRKLWRWRF